MKENDGELDEEDLEDNDMAIPRRYVAEDEIILDSFGNLRGCSQGLKVIEKNLLP